MVEYPSDDLVADEEWRNDWDYPDEDDEHQF